MRFFSFIIILFVILTGCKSQKSSSYSFANYESDMKPLNKEYDSLNSLFWEVYNNNDSIGISKINNEKTKIEKQQVLLSEKYISHNPNNTISLQLLSGLKNSYNYPVSSIKKYYNSLSKTLKKSSDGLAIKNQISIIESLSVGKKAPDFSAPDPDGKMVSLKESLGKVTIIDFWASWCGPCKKEHQNTVKLYDEYHSKGLNIIGVAMDRDKERWIEAIATDKLTWTQISNLEFWEDPIAKQYNVFSIPQTFVLDSKGRIVASGLRGDELRAKVKELLK